MRSMRSGLAAGFAALWVWLAVGCGSSRPNVVLITVGTLRADHLRSYGFHMGSSPRIDALAEQGVLFERAVAASSRTVPSLASTMTSRYVREHSVGYQSSGSRLEGLETLAQRFRDAGYHTGAFVGSALVVAGSGLERGFETFDDELSPRADRPELVERSAGATTQRALDWLRGVEAPFFLWIHYADPHGPYTSDFRDWGRFQLYREKDERKMAVPKRLAGRRSHRGQGRLPAYQYLPDLRFPSQYVTRYVGEIYAVDRSVGELIGAVDARSGEPSVILLTADHGESVGEGGLFFEHGQATTPDLVHVPLILRAPGLEPGRRRELVSQVDVLPTLLELAGIPVPADARGVSLGPLVRNRADLPERFVYSDVGSELSAYQGDTFWRVKGAGGAWQQAADPGFESAAAFRWNADDGWSPLPGAGPLPEPVREYAKRAAPLQPWPVDAERARQLGALGR